MRVSDDSQDLNKNGHTKMRAVKNDIHDTKPIKNEAGITPERIQISPSTFARCESLVDLYTVLLILEEVCRTKLGGSRNLPGSDARYRCKLPQNSDTHEQTQDNSNRPQLDGHECYQSKRLPPAQRRSPPSARPADSATETPSTAFAFAALALILAAALATETFSTFVTALAF